MWLLSILLPVAVAAFAHATAGHIDTGKVKDHGQTIKQRFASWWTQKGQEETQAVAPTPKSAVKAKPQRAAKKTVKKTTKETVGNGDLDSVDNAIIAFLSDGPAKASEIGKEVGLSSTAIYRMKSGKPSGRMTKLSDMGKVSYDEGSKLWSLVNESSSVLVDFDIASTGIVTVNGTEAIETSSGTNGGGESMG